MTGAASPRHRARHHDRGPARARGARPRATARPRPSRRRVSAGKATRWRLSARRRRRDPGVLPHRRLAPVAHAGRRRRVPHDRPTAHARPAARARSTYRGTLQSLGLPVSADTHRITVNKVSLDDYVRGVIPREMPALVAPGRAAGAGDRGAHLCAFEAADSTNPRLPALRHQRCQVYGGLSAEHPSTNEAMAKTAGQIRLYQGDPAFTQFSSSNGGWTATAASPTWTPSRTPTTAGRRNPSTPGRPRSPRRRSRRHWPGIGNLTSITVDSRDGNGQWNGRVELLTLHGAKGDRQISGDDFRSASACAPPGSTCPPAVEEGALRPSRHLGNQCPVARRPEPPFRLG